ncbi:unnamed protein product, partial [Scytosiphon promiscuus]
LRPRHPDSALSAARQLRDGFDVVTSRPCGRTDQAPPEKFGETLEAEQLRAGSFVEDYSCSSSGDVVDADQWERMMEIEVGNGDNKLFGGAQYHRALR